MGKKRNQVGEIKATGEALVKQKLAELEKMKSDWEKAAINCAVIGSRGAGKSTFINAVVGKQICKTGVTETTMDIKSPKSYSKPGTNLYFYDLPGGGTIKFPIETYIKDLNHEKYDLFVIFVSSDGVMEQDQKIFHEISIKLKRPCFIIRSKADDIARQAPRNIPKKSPEQGLSEARTEISKKLKISSKEVFLISSWEPKNFDFPKLMDALHGALSSQIKKDKFAAEAKAYNERFLAKKRKAAERVVTYSAGLVAAASAAANIVPGAGAIPGAAIDFSALLLMAKKVRDIYGISENDLNPDHFQKAAWVELQERIAKYAAKFLLAEGVKVVLKRYAAAQAAKFAASWIPFIGVLVNSGISYALCYKFGKDLIDESESIAFDILEGSLESFENEEAA